MPGDPQNRAELLARIDASWREFQALLDALSLDDWERALGDGWSAKVHLGHVTAWERNVVARLQKADCRLAMGVPEGIWETDDTDALNGFLADSGLAVPLERVRADADVTHSRVVTQLASMTDDELLLPYSHYQPRDGDESLKDKPMFDLVHWDTWRHYEEHTGWLRAGLAG